MVCSLKESQVHQGQPPARCYAVLIKLNQRKLSLFNASAQGMNQKDSPIAVRFAVCIPQNMQCSINIKSMMAKPTYSIWISGPAERIMKNLFAELSKKIM